MRIDDYKPTFRGIMYFDKWGNGKVVESKEYTNWISKWIERKKNYMMSY